MKPLTICIEQGGKDQRLYFHKSPLILGRLAETDIRVDDAWVSELHCRFEVVEGTVLVQDLDSRNGTFVNGCRVRKSAVMPGDDLQVGYTHLQVQYEHGSLVPPPSAIYDTPADLDRDWEREQSCIDREFPPDRNA